MQLAAFIVLVFAGSPLGLGNMPMSNPGDGLFNALFYGAGTLARKRGWLSRPTPRGLLRSSVACVLVSWAIVIAGAVLVFAPGTPGSTLGAAIRTLGWMAGTQLILGPYSGAAAVCLFTFFRRCCDCKHALVSFLAAGAFAVYLLQYWAITFATYSFAVFLRHTQGVDVAFVNSTQSNTAIGVGHVYLGVLYVSVSSLIVSFTIGGLLKKIPYIGGVL